MLLFESVRCFYENKIVTDGLSFAVQPGEQVAIIGPNGAGKSTILRTIVGLVKYEGMIKVLDNVVTPHSITEVRKRTGYVAPDSNVQMFMPKVIDDMIFGPVNYGLPRQQALELAEKYLEEFGISELRDRLNHTLSEGEKRMAAIATILTMEPELLLMDEPTSNLDPHNRRLVIDRLNQIGGTKIIATHDLDMVLEVCDRVLLVNNGKIIADGESLDILENRRLLEDNNLELPLCMAGLPLRFRKILEGSNE